MKKTKTRIITIFTAMLLLLFGSAGVIHNVFADDGSSSRPSTSIALSPMLEKIIINPGDTYTGSFKVSVPATATNPVKFEVFLQNFYRDNDGNAVFEEVGNTGQILDWITIKMPDDNTIQPNETVLVHYTVDVPDNAPAGGQYAAITVKTVVSDENTKENTATIQEQLAIAYLLYAEITGDTIHQGEITDINLSNFLLDGNITASSVVKNTGNSYGTATYKLQVFPLFSSEEIYTNEEKPETHTILPDRTLFVSTDMPNTPPVGIFNAVYTVEFEGVTAQVSKLVIKCPLWLMLIVVFVIVGIIIWIVIRVRMRKRAEE